MQSRVKKSTPTPNDSPSARQSPGTQVDISIRDQHLTLTRDGEVVRSYPISSSRFGIGTQEGSFKTPTGNFRISQKIGGDMPHCTIFRSIVALGPEARH